MKYRYLFYLFLILALFGNSLASYIIHSIFVGVEFSQPQGKGKVEALLSIAFDDGNHQQLNAINYLNNQYHIPVTCYIISKYLSNPSPDRLNAEDVKLLAKNGNEIGSHSVNHKDLLYYFDEKSEIIQSGKDLEKLTGKPVKSFAYPYGRGNILAEREVKKIYKNARIVGGGFNTPLTDPYRICTQVVSSDIKIQMVRDWIDEAKKNNYWLVILFHNIDTGDYVYNCSPTKFRQICALISRSKIKILTVSDALELYKKQNLN